MTQLLHKHLTGKTIGAYYDVYNGLSHNYPEFIYEQAMMAELSRRRVACTHQEEYQIFYKDRLVGLQRLDIFVAEEVVVELKVKSRLIPLDQAQTISYLKIAGIQVGLLFNFGNRNPEFKRLYYESRDGNLQLVSQTKLGSDLLFPDITYRIIGGLFEVHKELGPGYIHRVYAKACLYELLSLGLNVKPLSQLTVFYKGESIGEIKLSHLLVEDEIMLFPVAIGTTNQIQPANLRKWMKSQGIKLGIIANFHTLHLKPEFMKEARGQSDTQD